MAQLEERRAEIDDTIDGLAVFTKKDRKRAGCIVTIGEDGEFCLHQGLVDRTAVHGAVDPGDVDGQDEDETGDAFTPASDDDEDGDFSPRPSSGAEQALRKECGFSQLLVDDLKAHRLQITRALSRDRLRRGVRPRALHAVCRSVRSALPFASA